MRPASVFAAASLSIAGPARAASGALDRAIAGARLSTTARPSALEAGQRLTGRLSRESRRGAVADATQARSL